MFKFEYDIINFSHSWKAKLLLKKQNTKSQEGDIINFQSYNNQIDHNILSHVQYDLLKYVKDSPVILERIVNESRNVLIAYKNLLLSQRQPSDVVEFISTVLDIARNQTFKINPKYLDDMTNIIIV